MQIIVKPLPGINELEKEVNRIFTKKYEEICHVKFKKFEKLKETPFVMVYLLKNCTNKNKILYEIMKYLKDTYSMASAGYYMVDETCKKDL